MMLKVHSDWSVHFQDVLKKRVIMPDFHQPTWVWGKNHVCFRRWKPALTGEEQAELFLTWLARHWFNPASPDNDI